MLQKKKREEQNSRVDSSLDTMNNSKKFGGQIRKYRHRTLISNDISQEEWVDHFTKYLLKIPQPRLRMQKIMGILRTMRKATMKILILI